MNGCILAKYPSVIAALSALILGLLPSHALSSDPTPLIHPWDCASNSECVTGFTCVQGSCRDASSTYGGRPVRLLALQTVDRSNRTNGSLWLRKRFKDLVSMTLSATGVFEVLDYDKSPVLNTKVIIDAANRRATYILETEITELSSDTAVFNVQFFDTEWEDRITDMATTIRMDTTTLNINTNDWINKLILRLTGRRSIIGSRLVAVRRVGTGIKELFEVTLGSPEPRQLTNHASLNLLPTWAPDGRIAYTGYKGTDTFLMILGQETPFSAQPGFNSGVSWTRDGNRAVMTLNRDDSAEVYEVHPVNGKPIRRLTSSPAVDTSPSFSPDGKQIVFVSDRNGGPQLFLMDIDGSTATQVSSHGPYNSSPDWHPTGPWIAYSSQTSGGFDIRILNVQTGFDRRLAGGRGRCEDPSWSPCGRYIAFTWYSRKLGTQDLYLVSADGLSLQRLTSDGGPYSAPSWQPLTDPSRTMP